MTETEQLEQLEALAKRRDQLLDDFKASRAIEQFIPDVFKHGTFRARVRSRGDKFFVTIHGVEYKAESLPPAYWNNLKAKLVKRKGETAS
tara:strand:+ start:10746 stop:11015 length:270 start_codon:yes stop_codon:yes gene_type:complete